MRRIPLTRGAEALVDDEDFERLTVTRWQVDDKGYAIRYRRRDGKDTTESMHRVIMNAPKGMEVDHINGNPLDNRRCNLRLVSRRQNSRNTRGHRDNVTGYKGVSLDRVRGTYRAVIVHEGQHHFLGRFRTAEAAARAYNDAARKYFGEFARLNAVPDERRTA
jgi:hypothetical protein